MSGDETTFAEVMFGVHRAVCALENANGMQPARGAVRDARRAFRQLLDYQKRGQLSVAEAAVLQTALDVLWGHLRSARATGNMRAS